MNKLRLTLLGAAMAALRRVRTGLRAAGQAAQGRPDAALYRHLRGARHRDRERLQAVCRREGRQARRPVDRVRQGRRRVRSVEGDRQRQQADQARQRRRARRHGPLRRRDGDGQGRQGDRHAADRAECRRRCGHRPDVRTQHLPQLVLQLAARLCDGRGRGQEGPQEGGHDHLEICGRRRVGARLQGRLREGRRQRRQGTEPCRSRTSSSRRC